MKRRKELSEDEIRMHDWETIQDSIYAKYPAIASMNRKDRRTQYGRRIIAEANREVEQAYFKFFGVKRTIGNVVIEVTSRQ